jgi:hypothetical protein
MLDKIYKGSKYLEAIGRGPNFEELTTSQKHNGMKTPETVCSAPCL